MAAKKVRRSNVTIEDARLIFRNFKGEETKFNRKGDRNFCVVLDQDTADALAADGWNVKIAPPREEGDDPLLYLKVKVKFGDFPPVVKQIISSKAEQLDEDTIGGLDIAAIEKADLTISPYEYDVNGKHGIAAYLKKMYVTIAEDDLDRKYAHILADEEELPFGD